MGRFELCSGLGRNSEPQIVYSLFRLREMHGVSEESLCNDRHEMKRRRKNASYQADPRLRQATRRKSPPLDDCG